MHLQLSPNFVRWSSVGRSVGRSLEPSKKGFTIFLIFSAVQARHSYSLVVHRNRLKECTDDECDCRKLRFVDFASPDFVSSDPTHRRRFSRSPCLGTRRRCRRCWAR